MILFRSVIVWYCIKLEIVQCIWKDVLVLMVILVIRYVFEDKDCAFNPFCNT